MPTQHNHAWVYWCSLLRDSDAIEIMRHLRAQYPESRAVTLTNKFIFLAQYLLTDEELIKAERVN